MTKTFCDRCGKEIVTKKFAWIRHQSLYAKFNFASTQGSDEGLRDRDIYVCPECEKSFISWFRHAGGERKEEV